MSGFNQNSNVLPNFMKNP